MHRFSVRSNRADLVDWREWGQEAFDEAREQDRPVALFLTAFWCGFCQRLDETTLSNDEVIALLNAYFIPVRVEESQRPDVDLRYNQGGWPTIAFITPAGDHLFSVNHMAPGPFLDLLAKTVRMYADDRPAIDRSVAEGRAEAEQRANAAHDRAPLGPAVLGEITGIVEGLIDPVHGGYDDPTGNKYLHTDANDLLLYLHGVTGHRSYLDHVVDTLEKMRGSRMYDEADGGYYRYSTRRDWREPHPEKLLADQAAVLRNCLRAYVLTGNPGLRSTADALVDYLLTTLSDESTGMFLGCQDYVRPDGGPLREPPPRGQRQLLSVLDDFIYCDQNAQAVSALLEAWWVLGRADARDRASAALDFLWRRMRDDAGRVYHVYAHGAPSAPGILADAAHLGNALADAFAVLGDEQHLQRARLLAASIEQAFRNPDGGYHDADEAGPAGMSSPLTILTQNAELASFFVKLGDLTEAPEHRRQAHWALRDFPNLHRAYNAFAAQFGQALSRLMSPPLLVEITGAPGADDVLEFARAAARDLRHPDLVLTFREALDGTSASATTRLDGRTVGPFHDPAQLRPGALGASTAGSAD